VAFIISSQGSTDETRNHEHLDGLLQRYRT